MTAFHRDTAQMRWTDTEVDTLRSMYLDGYSFSQIGAVLKCSRNACIGKAHRMGLAKRVTPDRKMRCTSARREPSKPRGVGVLRVPLERRVRERAEPHVELFPTASLETLRFDSCRWPVGDPRDADRGGFGYCGRAAEHGPYCTHHHQIAWREPEPAKRKQWTRAVHRAAGL